jgi:hypothetical protein
VYVELLSRKYHTAPNEGTLALVAKDSGLRGRPKSMGGAANGVRLREAGLEVTEFEFITINTTRTRTSACKTVFTFARISLIEKERQV